MTVDFSVMLARTPIAALVLLLGSISLAAEPRIAEKVDIATVWAGHPVGFDLLTHEDRQFVAYYDHERRLTVASRTVGNPHWIRKVLPSTLGWDSHNYIAMAVDDADRIHLAGNMHGVPLVYFRTDKPLDIATFRQAPSMVGREEQRVTYPRFFRGFRNELIFTYRDGGSGNGNQIYNAYDTPAGQWRRLLDQPLTDGEGKMNAYLHGPVRGPDDRFHLCWVWRDTPDCATNHTLSYARSKDLRHWETGAGRALKLPLRLENADIVDPVGPGGGMINGNAILGFDSRQRPIISYHKFDAAGATQLYNARLEDGKWKTYQTSNWTYRWEFSGGGTIIFEVHLSPVRILADGSLVQSYSHAKHGAGAWKLDEETLRPAGGFRQPPERPRELDQVESDFPGMQVRWKAGAGQEASPKSRYWLRWETLAANRDRPRPQPWPEPSVLRVYRIKIE